jgi:branched-chain amino acid transport system substrate-binding protein
LLCRHRVRVYLLAAVALLPYVAMTSASEPPSMIAIALPLTGPHKAIGANIKAAIELMMADLSATPGTRPVALSWHDDQCSSSGGVTAAKVIAANPPAAVIGHACPSAAQAAGPIYAAAKLPFLAAGQLPGRSIVTPRHGPLHFRMQPDDNQGREIGAYLATTSSAARVAFARDKTLFATTATAAAIAAFVARGRTPALTEIFSGGGKDFSPLAQRLKAANISHLVIAGFPNESALLVSEVRRLMPDIAITGTDTLADPTFGSAAGAAADSVQVALAPGVAAFPKAQPLVARLKAEGAAPSRSALTSAAALEIIQRALAATPTTEFAQAMAQKTFDTILSDINFDANGVARVPSHVFYVWRGGTLYAPVPR